jgi:mediator of replication checkpoint protein 1
MPRLMRLTKGRISPITVDDVFLEGGYRSSPSPGPSKAVTAFENLGRNALRYKGHEKQQLDKSEFVEAEAVESDEDEMRGFAGFGRTIDDANEEENGEDLDKNLEELVDDKEMNEEEVAKEKVLEKHQYVSRSMHVPELRI